MKDELVAHYELFWKAKREQRLAERAGERITLAEAVRRVTGK